MIDCARRSLPQTYQQSALLSVQSRQSRHRRRSARLRHRRPTAAASTATSLTASAIADRADSATGVTRVAGRSRIRSVCPWNAVGRGHRVHRRDEASDGVTWSAIAPGRHARRRFVDSGPRLLDDLLLPRPGRLRARAARPRARSSVPRRGPARCPVWPVRCVIDRDPEDQPFTGPVATFTDANTTTTARELRRDDQLGRRTVQRGDESAEGTARSRSAALTSTARNGHLRSHGDRDDDRARHRPAWRRTAPPRSAFRRLESSAAASRSPAMCGEVIGR